MTAPGWGRCPHLPPTTDGIEQPSTHCSLVSSLPHACYPALPRPPIPPPPSPAALRVPVRPTWARYVGALWRLPFPLPYPSPALLRSPSHSSGTTGYSQLRLRWRTFHNPQPADTFHDYEYELVSVSPASGPLHSCFCTGRLARRRKSYDRHCSGCPARLPSAYSTPGNTALDGPGPHACTSAPTTGPTLGRRGLPAASRVGACRRGPGGRTRPVPFTPPRPDLHSSRQPTSPTFSPVGSPPRLGQPF